MATLATEGKEGKEGKEAPRAQLTRAPAENGPVKKKIKVAKNFKKDQIEKTRLRFMMAGGPNEKEGEIKRSEE